MNPTSAGRRWLQKFVFFVFVYCWHIVSVGWSEDDEKAVPVLPKDTMPEVIAWDQVPVGFEESASGSERLTR